MARALVFGTPVLFIAFTGAIWLVTGSTLRPIGALRAMVAAQDRLAASTADASPATRASISGPAVWPLAEGWLD